MPTNFKLQWDKTGERLYELGVSRGVLYVQSDGAYPKGVVWNGLTQVSENPEGADPNDLWADNIKYATLRSTETFKATVEAYTYPDEFAECDGSACPTGTSGLYIGQQQRKAFGLCYRTEIGSDTNQDTTNSYKLHLVYGCTASPSDKGYETINDSPDAITFSWEIDTVPVSVTGLKPTSCIVIDSTKVDATALASLETILYGSGATDGRLPLPDEVISLLNGSASYTIDNYLTNVVNDNTATSIAANGEYVAHLTAAEDYTIANVIVTMGGVDVTSTAYDSGTVTISAVTGNVVIMATANA